MNSSMKNSSHIKIVIILALSLLSGCNQKEVISNASLTKFQADMKGVENLLETYRRSVGDPLKSLETLSALNEGLSLIKTGELPGDLASSFSKYRTTMRGLLSHLHSTPFPTELLSEGTRGVSNWIKEQTASNPKFLESYMRKMDAWDKESASYQKRVMVSIYHLSMAMQNHNIDFDFEVGADVLGLE